MGCFDDVYSSPERYGLRMIGSIEWDDEPYSFDMTALWVHHESGTIYAGSDSGCSCPSPFETVFSLEELTLIKGPRELIEYFAEHVENRPAKVGEVGELIMKARIPAIRRDPPS